MLASSGEALGHEEERVGSKHGRRISDRSTACVRTGVRKPQRKELSGNDQQGGVLKGPGKNRNLPVRLATLETRTVTFCSQSTKEKFLELGSVCCLSV